MPPTALAPPVVGGAESKLAGPNGLAMLSSGHRNMRGLGDGVHGRDDGIFLAMIDFHNHLIPGVDDGASDLDQSRAALTAMWSQGIRTVITTPHVDGSLTHHPERLTKRLAELDAGWEQFRELAGREFPELRIERGAEVMLDAPGVDLSESRLRLAGSAFALVEFPFMSIPPNSSEAIFALKMQGVAPIIAHPQRYAEVDKGLHLVEAWRRVGGLLQVNSGSLVGRYGDRAKSVAWQLLRSGWVDYLASDYHCRGRCATAEARAKLTEEGGEEQARWLLEINPQRLLDGRASEEVAPLEPAGGGLWRRILSFGRAS